MVKTIWCCYTRREIMYGNSAGKKTERYQDPNHFVPHTNDQHNPLKQKLALCPYMIYYYTNFSTTYNNTELLFILKTINVIIWDTFMTKVKHLGSTAFTHFRQKLLLE